MLQQQYSWRMQRSSSTTSCLRLLVCCSNIPMFNAKGEMNSPFACSANLRHSYPPPTQSWPFGQVLAPCGGLQYRPVAFLHSASPSKSVQHILLGGLLWQTLGFKLYTSLRIAFARTASV